MATPQQLEVLAHFFDAAKVAKHIFPEAAACEGVEETDWGRSKLYTLYRNVFGQKQSHVPIYSTVKMPTQEWLVNKWVGTMADFVVFPTAVEAFEARMDLLVRLSKQYQDYYAALHAATPEEFLTDVSRTWSTDPHRAQRCIEILHAHSDILTNLPPVETA